VANEANLLSTPEGYATPGQLASTREYAKALLHGNMQQPVSHWSQGVSNMVSALVGGNLDFNANKKQNESDAVRAGRMLPTIPGSPSTQPPGGMAPTSFSGDPSPAGVKDTGGDASKAISGIESGGNYAELGPVIPKSGDRAYGKYQVMGNNIPEWSQAALGKPMTKEEFLANPQAQEAVFKHKFGEYTQKYGPEGASRAWFAGEGGMNNPNAKDMLGTTVAGYSKKFSNAYGGGGGAPPAAPVGAPAGPDGAPPTVQLAASALRGGAKPPVIGGGGGNVMPGDAQQGQPLINPNLIQRKPQYTEGQMRGILADPTISEQAKLGLMQQYQQQDQPITMPYPGGNVIIDPRDPRRQQFIPDLQKGTKKLGDMEVPSYNIVGPGGAGGPGMQLKPIEQAPAAVGPRSEGTPPAAPTGGPAGAPPIVPVVAQNAPAAPTPAPEAVPNTGGVQVASNDPTSGVAAAAAGAGGGGAPAKAPSPFESGAPALAAAPAATGPLAGFAQAKPPGVTDEQLKLNNFAPGDVQDYTNKKAFEQQKTLELEKGKADIGVNADAQKEANKHSAKNYDDLQISANAAAEQRNNVAMARKQIEDPNFYAGMGNGLVENWKRFKSAAGIDPDAARPMEVFRKTTAQSIMSNLKTAFGGLGQIRVAEIRLQEQANASTSNTPSAIKALLEITDRNAAKAQQIGEMAATYKNGEAIMDPKDPSKVLLKANVGPDGEPMERVGLDSHWDKFLHQYTKDHPTFSKDEFDTFTEDLKGRKGEKDVIEPKSGEAKSLGATEPGMTYKGYQFKGGDQHDENNWEKVKKK